MEEELKMRRKVTFFTSFTFTWWQVGLVKLSLLSLGVVVGATWPGIFAEWRALLLVLFVGPAFYMSYVALKQI
jgi:hypothetical protein